MTPHSEAEPGSFGAFATDIANIGKYSLHPMHFMQPKNAYLQTTMHIVILNDRHDVTF